MKYLIFTGGSIDDTFAASFLETIAPDVILAADRGIEAADRLGLPVDILLGDFDSASFDVLTKYESRPGLRIVRHNPIKDQTDTELAICYALDHSAHEIWILGGTGSRIDHLLGTIHSLKAALDRNVECILADPNNRIRLLGPGTHILKKETLFGRYLSLIPLTETVSDVTLKGVKYPLSHSSFTLGNSLGVSNEVTEDHAEISFRKGILIEILSQD